MGFGELKIEEIPSQEDPRPRIYLAERDVLVDSEKNSVGGVTEERGILYKYADGPKAGQDAGILTHSVGPDGTSTGIFELMKGTAVGEVAITVEKPEKDK